MQAVHDYAPLDVTVHQGGDGKAFGYPKAKGEIFGHGFCGVGMFTDWGYGIFDPWPYVCF